MLIYDVRKTYGKKETACGDNEALLYPELVTREVENAGELLPADSQNKKAVKIKKKLDDKLFELEDRIKYNIRYYISKAKRWSQDIVYDEYLLSQLLLEGKRESLWGMTIFAHPHVKLRKDILKDDKNRLKEVGSELKDALNYLHSEEQKIINLQDELCEMTGNNAYRVFKPLQGKGIEFCELMLEQYKKPDVNYLRNLFCLTDIKLAERKKKADEYAATHPSEDWDLWNPFDSNLDFD